MSKSFVDTLLLDGGVGINDGVVSERKRLYAAIGNSRHLRATESLRKSIPQLAYEEVERLIEIEEAQFKNWMKLKRQLISATKEVVR